MKPSVYGRFTVPFIRKPVAAASALLLLLMIQNPARAAIDVNAETDTVAIPMNQIMAPASDLTYQGRPIDRDTAVDLIKRGVDISKLDPVPNDAWTPKALPMIDPTQAYPAEGATINFVSLYASSFGLFRVQVTS